tara:strand:- start:1933 stop:2613 length:681 start_codon:yes stop_codon:yes gene_type:complete
MNTPRPLLLTFFLVSASFWGFAQSPPVTPPTTHPTYGDNYREKYEAAVLEVEEANRTLAELLDILAGKEEKSKILNLDSKHLKEVDLPAAQTGLEKSNTQLANLIQEKDGLNDAIDFERTKVDELALVERNLITKINRYAAKVTQGESDLSSLVLEADGVLENLKVPHLPYWHYLDGKGWLWTDPESYPFVYSYDRENWVYYNQGTHSPWQFFDYRSDSWEEWFVD